MRDGMPGPVGMPPPNARQRASTRAKRRRRRAVVLTLLVVATMLVAVELARTVLKASQHGGTNAFNANTSVTGQTSDATGRPSASQAASAATATPTEAAATYTGPVTGPGTFTYATTQSAILGTAGTLHRFRVAVENGTGQDANAFAAAATETLSNPQSWIAGNNVRLQQVPAGAAYDFTLYLATPGTSETMCARGGLQTQKYTSCRLAGQVIINLARWLTAIPDYGAPLGVYQQYAINHEVGHELGHGHEACPGPGQPAPVMQQQTYGLKGCIANPWPYLNGQRYAGQPIA